MDFRELTIPVSQFQQLIDPIIDLLPNKVGFFCSPNNKVKAELNKILSYVVGNRDNNEAINLFQALTTAKHLNSITDILTSSSGHNKNFTQKPFIALIEKLDQISEATHFGTDLKQFLQQQHKTYQQEIKAREKAIRQGQNQAYKMVGACTGPHMAVYTVPTVGMK